jgi:hypothetical protein
MFYCKFGKCNKGDKCPYIHDPSKVAVCRKFLQGKCQDEKCPLSHKLSSKDQSMPVCWFFLRGVCTNENCPYSHVKVSPDAEVCEAFLKGFCPAGSACKLLHTDECPAFKLTGSCPRGEQCKLKHKQPLKRKKKAGEAKPGRAKKRKVPVLRRQEERESDKVEGTDAALELQSGPIRPKLGPPSASPAGPE